MTNPQSVTAPEAVALLHPVISRFIADRGIRALLIKGPMLSDLGLRTPRNSGDVDLLVDPGEHDRLIEQLATWGWQSRDLGPAARSADNHAVTLVHERWPTTIDVHRFYPGFAADDQRVFDELWRDRTSAEVAHQEVTTTGLAGSVLIQGLHLERSRDQPAAAKDRDDLIAAMQGHSPQMRSDIALLAERTGCVDLLNELFESVGIEANSATTDPSGLARWHRIDERRTAGVAWADVVRTARWRHKPRLVIAALTFDAHKSRAGSQHPYTYHPAHVFRRVRRYLSRRPGPSS